MSMINFVNTVPGEQQLKDNDFLSYMGCTEASKKILIVGNSITRHNPKVDIGWHGDWGMAASCADKDYVHILYRMLTEYFGKVSVCVAQAAAWEVTEHTKKKEKLYESYTPAAEFGADLIIVRIGENIDMTKLNALEVAEDFQEMIRFFGGGKKNTRVIVSGLFWDSPECEEKIKLALKTTEYCYVPLSDLGMDESMTAIGLFEHTGVAGHPGDRGMEHIAKRIMGKVKEMYDAGTLV